MKKNPKQSKSAQQNPDDKLASSIKKVTGAAPPPASADVTSGATNVAHQPQPAIKAVERESTALSGTTSNRPARRASTKLDAGNEAASQQDKTNDCQTCRAASRSASRSAWVAAVGAIATIAAAMIGAISLPWQIEKTEAETKAINVTRLVQLQELSELRYGRTPDINQMKEVDRQKFEQLQKQINESLDRLGEALRPMGPEQLARLLSGAVGRDEITIPTELAAPGEAMSVDIDSSLSEGIRVSVPSPPDWVIEEQVLWRKFDSLCNSGDWMKDSAEIIKAGGDLLLALERNDRHRPELSLRDELRRTLVIATTNLSCDLLYFSPFVIPGERALGVVDAGVAPDNASAEDMLRVARDHCVNIRMLVRMNQPISLSGLAVESWTRVLDLNSRKLTLVLDPSNSRLTAWRGLDEESSATIVRSFVTESAGSGVAPGSPGLYRITNLRLDPNSSIGSGLGTERIFKRSGDSVALHAMELQSIADPSVELTLHFTTPAGRKHQTAASTGATRDQEAVVLSDSCLSALFCIVVPGVVVEIRGS